MRLLFLSLSDYANIMGEWTYALKKYCKENKLQHHISYIQIFSNGHYTHKRGKEYNEIHKYKNILTTGNKNLFINIFNDYIVKNKIKTIIIEDSIFNYFSSVLILSLIKFWYNRDNTLKFIIFHNGSLYRKYFKILNQYDSNLYIYKVIYGADLFRLGNIDIKKKLIIIPTFYIKYTKEMIKEKFNKEKLTIFHCPSRDKGSIFIEKNIKNILTKYNLRDKYKFVMQTGITIEKVLELKKQSHIYIGQFCDGKYSTQKVGGFGLSAIESLATGNIVLCLNDKIPVEMAKKLPIINLENEEKFESIVSNLLLKDKKDLLDIANISFDYFNNEIGYKSVYNNFLALS
jgi:hypothetical protein